MPMNPLLKKAAKFLPKSGNQNVDKNVGKAINTAAAGSSIISSWPLVKWGTVAVVIIIVLVLLGGSFGGVSNIANNITYPAKCNPTTDIQGWLTQAQQNGLKVSPEIQKQALGTTTSNPCDTGVGYNGQTFPPTEGIITTLYGQVDALHPTPHPGLDIAGKCNDPIYAFTGGKVTELVLGSESKSTPGHFVQPMGVIGITSGDALMTRYLHVKGSTTYVHIGDIVSAGQLIARQWSNGYSTGCHLHFEMYVNGKRTDPLPVLLAAGYPYSKTKFYSSSQFPSKPIPGNAGSGKVFPTGSAQAIAKSKMASYGWSDPKEFTCLVDLWNGESGWRVNANNPSSGAYGIPQALPGSKMASVGADWKTNPATQITWGMNYLQSRYVTPCNAWTTWNNRTPHWY